MEYLNYYSYLAFMLILVFGTELNSIVLCSGPTSYISWVVRVIIAKYCGKEDVNIRTTLCGRSRWLRLYWLMWWCGETASFSIRIGGEKVVLALAVYGMEKLIKRKRKRRKQTTEEIESMHETYVKELQKLYNKYNPIYGDVNVKLVIEWFTI